MCNKKNLVFKIIDNTEIDNTEEEFVNVYCKDDDQNLTKIDIINPMIKYNSQVSWGYKGGGPITLTLLLMDIVWGEKPKDAIGFKYYSKSYKNLLEHISKYDENSDTFEISGSDILNMFVRPDIETYKFNVLKDWLNSVMNFADANGLNSVDKMYTLLRVNMPYSITISNDLVSFANRDHLQLGIINGAFLNTGSVPDVHTMITDDVVYDILNTDDRNIIYFYDDSCKPWESKKNLIAYLDRLDSVIGKLTGVNIKRPIFIK